MSAKKIVVVGKSNALDIKQLLSSRLNGKCLLFFFYVENMENDTQGTKMCKCQIYIAYFSSANFHKLFRGYIT